MGEDIINGVTGEPMVATQKTQRDLEPGPGTVLVLRPKDDDVSEAYSTVVGEDGVVRPIFKGAEERKTEAFYSRFATVLRIPSEDAPNLWFAEGDEVVIQHTLFNEVELSPGVTVWWGPQTGVKCKFVERPVD